MATSLSLTISDVGHLSSYPISISLTSTVATYSPARYWSLLCYRNRPRYFHLRSRIGGSPQSWYHHRSCHLQGLPSLEGSQIHCRPDLGCLRRVPRRLRPILRTNKSPHRGPRRSGCTRYDQLHTPGNRWFLWVVRSCRCITQICLLQRIHLRKCFTHPSLSISFFYLPS